MLQSRDAWNEFNDEWHDKKEMRRDFKWNKKKENRIFTHTHTSLLGDWKFSLSQFYISFHRCEKLSKLSCQCARVCLCVPFDNSTHVYSLFWIIFFSRNEKKSCAHIKRALNYKKKYKKNLIGYFIVYPHSHRDVHTERERRQWKK